MSMIRSHSSKSRQLRKSGPNCISIGNPLAVSIQLKPSHKSQSVSPTSHSVNLSRSFTSVSRSRANSAHVKKSIISVLPTKTFTNWVAKSQQNMNQIDVKWIGVHRNLKPNQQVCRQYFPKRQQRVADQSFANFMLQYGKQLKRSRQSTQFLKATQPQDNSNFFTNAATIKLKPRLTWFQRKKRKSFQNSEVVKSKSKLEVVWKRNQ